MQDSLPQEPAKVRWQDHILRPSGPRSQIIHQRSLPSDLQGRQIPRWSDVNISAPLYLLYFRLSPRPSRRPCTVFLLFTLFCVLCRPSRALTWRKSWTTSCRHYNNRWNSSLRNTTNSSTYPPNTPPQSRSSKWRTKRGSRDSEVCCKTSTGGSERT